MLRFVKQIVWSLGLVIGCQSAFGFALIGPVPTATTDPDGFQASPAGAQIAYDIGNAENGVPKDIKDEYRRNTPVMYYSFDQSFVNYFEDRGKAEVDKAYAMFNAVGNASTLDINDFPEDSRRVNFRAQADSLLDLKSVIMGMMTEQLGFFQPTRWVWALHDRIHLTPGPACPLNMEYLIIKKNFSTVSVDDSAPPTTSYVNGVLYTYFIDEFCSPPNPLADAVEFPVDPLSSPYSAVADFTSFWYAGLPIGGFYTSLTRDDVAAIKYLVATNNFNNEAAGGRVTEFVTNSQPAVIQTQDLNLFATQARVNTAAALQALYPGLIITSTSNSFGLQITTNITQFLVNSPTDPAGLAPTHAVFSTNYTTNFVQFFDHTFANVVTNSFATRGIVGTLTLGLSNAPFAPAGTIPTVNTNGLIFIKPVPVNGVFGDFFILPTNQCGALILSNLLTTVTATTNLPIQIIGAGLTNPAITFIPGNITFSTGHVVVYLPVNCPVDSVGVRGGVDRMIFVRREFDSLSQQIWDPVTNDYTLLESDETNKVINLRHFQRRVPRPDFLMLGADLVTESGFSYTNIVDGAAGIFNFSIFNFGSANFTDTIDYDQNGKSGVRAGPGTIVSPPILPTLFIFNTVSPLFLNATAIAGTTNNFLAPNELTQIPIAGWGSFDGTTNVPVVYPNGTSLEEFESTIIGPSTTTPSLPTGSIGHAYSTQLGANGGHGPYTWALAPTSPGLPAGLNISSTGKIAGVPSGPAAIYDFTLRLTDSVGQFRDIQFTITIF
jgi:hypothetical protein